MKKLIMVLALFSLILCSLSGCRIEGYDTGYDDGYYAGYDDGYAKGIEKAQKFLAFVVDDDLSSIAWDIKDEYGMFPEDALNVLTNYIDVPDEVDEQDLVDAIYAVRSYYYRSNKVINDIEDYWID